MMARRADSLDMSFKKDSIVYIFLGQIQAFGNAWTPLGEGI